MAEDPSGFTDAGAHGSLHEAGVTPIGGFAGKEHSTSERFSQLFVVVDSDTDRGG